MDEIDKITFNERMKDVLALAQVELAIYAAENPKVIQTMNRCVKKFLDKAKEKQRLLEEKEL